VVISHYVTLNILMKIGKNRYGLSSNVSLR